MALQGRPTPSRPSVKINSVHQGSGRGHHKASHQRLMEMSANLPAPPDTFDPDRQYRVKLNAVVAMPNTPNMLRPSQDVVVSGSFAETIRSAIVGAVAL
jgi:hypothetical protein